MVEGWQNWDMLGMLEQIQGSGRSATYINAGPRRELRAGHDGQRSEKEAS